VSNLSDASYLKWYLSGQSIKHCPGLANSQQLRPHHEARYNMELHYKHYLLQLGSAFLPMSLLGLILQSWVVTSMFTESSYSVLHTMFRLRRLLQSTGNHRTGQP